jgi:hypothetical protein
VPIDAARLHEDVLRLPWRTVLSTPLVARDAATASDGGIMAAVPFLGAWSGWLRVQCDPAIAEEIAGRLRGVQPAGPDDLENAVRWIADAIAQALQPALDGAAKLGPSTIVDASAPWSPRSCRPVARLAFASGDRLLSVALDERVPIAVRKTDAFRSDLDDDGSGPFVRASADEDG